MAAPAGASPAPVEPAAAPAEKAVVSSARVGPRPTYRTMLSLPCAIVDARTIACMERHRVMVERHALDGTFDPEDHFVHLEGSRDRVCALVRPSGRVFCWSEERGPSLSGDPAAGFDFTVVKGAVDFGLLEDGVCILSDGGQVRCGGKNGAGQLGDGSRDDRETLEPVELPGTAIDIETGWRSACAQLSSGEVHCWGSNETAGDPRRTRPTAIRGLPENVSLATTDQAVTSAGERWRWRLLDHVPERGYTTAERIEDANPSSLTCWRVEDELWCETGPDDAPERLLDHVREVDLRHGAYCARLEDGSVWCVGHGLTLANAAPDIDPDEPTRVPGLAAVSAVAMSLQGACVIHDGGAVSCWGDAPTAHAPNQNPSFVGTPRAIPLPGPAQEIVVAEDGACARVDGRAHCWGRNGKVLDLGAADGLTVRGDHPCAGAADATRCMQQGRAWYRDPDLREVPAESSSDVRNFDHICRATRGKVRCGHSRERIVCSSDAPDADCHMETEEDEPWTFDSPLTYRRAKDTLIVGARAACVLSDAGRLRCRVDADGPRIAAPATKDDIVHASVGFVALCAVDRGGRVECWGSLSMDEARTVSVVAGIDDARSVHVGGSVACAIRGDGSLWCWGGSRHGERGLGGESWRESWTPVRLEALQGE